MMSPSLTISRLKRTVVERAEVALALRDMVLQRALLLAQDAALLLGLALADGDLVAFVPLLALRAALGRRHAVLLAQRLLRSRHMRAVGFACAGAGYWGP